MVIIKKFHFVRVIVVDLPISPYAASKKKQQNYYSYLSSSNNFNIRVFDFLQYMALARDRIWQYLSLLRPYLMVMKFRCMGMVLVNGYTCIDDIVDGIIKSLNNLNGYNIYNLGESRTIKLKG